jgi:predicted dehydrogenase
MIRLAVVGVGGYGWKLVRTIREVAEQESCRLVAAADTQWDQLPDRRRSLAEAGVALYDDALAMYDDLAGRCDAVYIATGIGSHAKLTAAAARAGMDVHLEKPPAGTVQEVDEMLAALTETGKHCLVGFQALHSEDILGVKRRILDGRLGRVNTVSCYACWPRKGRYYNRNDWAGKLRSGNRWVLDGPAMNALAHQVMNMLFWTGDEITTAATPAAVRAELYAAGPAESHNTAAIEIQTAQGPRLYFLGTHTSEGAAGPHLHLEAENGTVDWSMHGRSQIRYADGTEESIPWDPQQWQTMVHNLLDVVRSGNASDLRSSLATCRTFTLALNGAHESSGRIHRIDDPIEVIDADDRDHKRWAVRGIDDVLARAAAGPCLLSDLPDAPDWTQPTEPFDLDGYREFPARFTADPA